MPEYSFDGNDRLKPAGVVMHLTAKEVMERIKCQNDPLYFIKNYIKVVRPGYGMVPFIPWPYQEEMAKLILGNRFVIGKLSRQSGKSTIAAAVICWMMLFSEIDRINILVAAHKSAAAVEIMRKVKIAIENVPSFLQLGIVKWNELGVELENGSRCTAVTTTADTGRSGSYDMIMLDEFAFVRPNIAEAFYTSSYPTIASSPTSKVVVLSTPNGMNLYHSMWDKAEKGESDYKPISIKWDDVPGRDEEYKTLTIANLGHNGQAQWEQEYECQFAGGSNSLIPSAAIMMQRTSDPIKVLPPDEIKVWYDPVPGNSYMICVDTARGKGIDYSAFTVIDITAPPFEVVATFRKDDCDVMYYPEIIHHAAKIYNEALCLIETNDLGQSIVNTLFYTIEYGNILGVETKGKTGQVLSGNATQLGICTSARTKSVGCQALKALCESSQIKVNDWEIIREMSNFVRTGNSYKAEKGNHDDLIMTLVLFAWATTQDYFSSLTETNIREVMFAKRIEQAEQELLPHGFSNQDDNYEVEIFSDNF